MASLGRMDSRFILRDWEDEDRMHFMYSPFPNDRNINPRHWDSKVNFWTEEIKRCCSFYLDVCISCEQLRRRFSMKDGRVPHGLSIVICKMQEEGLLANKESLLRSLEDNWFGWTYSLIKGSAKWIFSTVLKQNARSDHEEYVVCDSLNVLGKEILKRHFDVAKFDKTDHVVPWKVVKHYCIQIKPDISDNELMLVLAHLKSKRQIELATNSHGEKLIKFTSNLNTAVEKINENDWHILRLKRAIAKLKIQTVEDKKEMSKLQNVASTCLKHGDKLQAKRLLYQRKKLEKSLNLKQDTLLSLTDQLITIQNADSNKMILDAIACSSKLLNASLQDNELSPELVDEVFDQNIEASNYAEEIDRTISQGLMQSEGDLDLQELEQELSKLLYEDVSEMKEKPMTEESHTLPDVPKLTPGKFQDKKDSRNRIRALAD